MANLEEIRKRTEDIHDRLNKDGFDVQRFGDDPEDIPRIHTGSYKLDNILGGGWPEGRLIELFGVASSGKTTCAIHAVKEAQKEGEVCGYVDAEQSLDPVYAFDGIGADQQSLIFQQPDSGEQALQLVESMVEEGVGLVILDSVASLVPQAELDGDIGDDHVGLLARLMSQTLRKLSSTVKEAGATVIFVNQLRSTIGQMFGPDETTPGGRALKFYSSIRLRLAPSSHVKDGGETVANYINARCVKNKTAAPFKKDKLLIRYGEGLDRAFELAEHAEEAGAVEQAGSWYKIAGETICQGSEALRAFVRDNDAIEPDGGFPHNLGMRDRLARRIKQLKSGAISQGEFINKEEQ